MECSYLSRVATRSFKLNQAGKALYTRKLGYGVHDSVWYIPISKLHLVTQKRLHAISLCCILSLSSAKL